MATAQSEVETPVLAGPEYTGYIRLVSGIRLTTEVAHIPLREHLHSLTHLVVNETTIDRVSRQLAGIRSIEVNGQTYSLDDLSLFANQSVEQMGIFALVRDHVQVVAGVRASTHPALARLRDYQGIQQRASALRTIQRP